MGPQEHPRVAEYPKAMISPQFRQLVLGAIFRLRSRAWPDKKMVGPAAIEFTREHDIAELRPTIGFHGSEALCRLKIVEIQLTALVRGGGRVDDARGTRG